MNDKDPDSELIAEIEKRISQGTEFDGLTRVKARKPRNPRAVFSVRLSPDEFAVISRAASSRGSTVSDFVREVAVDAAAAEGAGEYSLASFRADIAQLNRKLDRAAKTQTGSSAWGSKTG